MKKRSWIPYLPTHLLRSQRTLATGPEVIRLGRLRL